MPSCTSLSVPKPVVCCPFSDIEPPSTCVRPNIDLITVDLPLPFGPIIVTSSPACTCIVMPRTISVAP